MSAVSLAIVINQPVIGDTLTYRSAVSRRIKFELLICSLISTSDSDSAATIQGWQCPSFRKSFQQYTSAVLFFSMFSVFSSYEIIVSNYSTLVAKTREATVPTATWGRLDTNIMKMWLCSVSKDESLDPLVELVIPLICIHSISLVGAIYFSCISSSFSPISRSFTRWPQVENSRDLAEGFHIIFRK